MPLLCAATLIVVVATGCASTTTPTQGQRADVAHFVLERLDAAWRGDGRYDRPSTVAPRFVLPKGWGFAMKECMVDSGFTAFDFDRTAGFTNGLERTSSLGEEGLAWYNCSAQLPTFTTEFSRLDDGQIDELYRYYTEWLVPCLALEGTPVLTVPTRDQFADGVAGQPGSWNPYLTAEPHPSIAVASAVLDSCAPYPLDWSSEVAARP